MNFSTNIKIISIQFEFVSSLIGKYCLVQPGWYITVHVVGVPSSLITARLGSQPIVLYGMLPHEQKMSVLNMVLKRPAVIGFEDPIKSKESLVFQCGYRRFRAKPIFSQHTNGAKHKVIQYVVSFFIINNLACCIEQIFSISVHFWSLSRDNKERYCG